ncbi:uncharacterized protein LOC111372911 isoform X2 [Olea europaea var. sylvestris]|uniref:uncharacterized protein LOC111372911 isoform X2 n=1 Tax=Olea europaea var. sylvestris TaxID=158386 RepID=UPI000C1D5824|nr:uncharacterized protein LOC111372911 isoform X2 [Olea europaea var. sylvestris]
MGFWTMVRFFFISLRFLTYTCTHARSMGNKENGERCPLSHTAVTVSLDIQVFKYRGREERRGKILRSDIGYLTEGTQERLGSIHLSQVF